MPLVTINNVHKSFKRGSQATVYAVSGASLEIERAETVALIGESGSGKSTLGWLALGLYQPDQGAVSFDGRRINGLKPGEMRSLRSRMTMVFQEPYGSLNPMMSIGQIVAEPLAIHDKDIGPDARRSRALATLERVQLDGSLYDRRPGDLSGGQQQRVGIARAIVTQPDFVVLDEPTSSLDLSVQAGILELLAELRDELGLAYLYISHDLDTVDHFSDRVAVMYLGQIVEIGPKASVLDDPRRPYTEALLSASLDADPTVTLAPLRVSGEIPSPTDLPAGCFFYSRCAYRSDPRCATERPPLRETGQDHWVATFCDLTEASVQSPATSEADPDGG